eukprot:jgi/Tetstr1/433511/TSEL_022781.t1
MASGFLGLAACNRRYLPAHQPASFAGKPQFLYLAIAPAHFFLRELHWVLITRPGWEGRVELAHELKRDVEWWTSRLAQYNGRSIFKPIESSYLHVDSGGHG